MRPKGSETAAFITDNSQFNSNMSKYDLQKERRDTGMILYHGTNADFDRISLTIGLRYKDFGWGFCQTARPLSAWHRRKHGSSVARPRLSV